MHLLLIEDERKVASFIARSLKENGHTVDVAENGEKGLGMLDHISYDAVLLDIRLPGMSGIQVCREIRQSKMDIPVLMLTARSLVDQRVEGLDAGADDYLTKPFALTELHARVRALTRRVSVNKLHCADLELDRQRRVAARAGEPISLTSKELSLLELLLLRSPNHVGRTEIVEHVWSYGFDSESNLVEVYINRLRQKVDQHHKVKLIHTVRGIGYRLGIPE